MPLAESRQQDANLTQEVALCGIRLPIVIEGFAGCAVAFAQNIIEVLKEGFDAYFLGSHDDSLL